MKEIINFMSNHCSKEEFIEMIKDTDACPGFFSLIGDPTGCLNKKGCERCWEQALKDINFLEEEETEVIYQIGDNKIYTAVDNKLTEECIIDKKSMKEKKYSFLDIERLEAELKRINTSRGIAGIEMVERMLKEVKEDVNRREN